MSAFENGEKGGTDMKNRIHTIMPLQPYIVLQADSYDRIVDRDYGISHFYQFKVAEEGQRSVNAVPDGSIDLLFNIGENGVHTYISGTVFKAKPWEFGEERTCFGVRFQPGQGVLPKEMSIEMLVNQDIEIDGNLFGDHLEEKIAQAKTMQERAVIFKEAYESLVIATQKEDTKKNIDIYMQNRISQTYGTVGMEQLAEETGYSSCYLRRIFKECHGISPKQFAQFVRFQNLLQTLKRGSQPYGEIALDCGYYDEAHMMKEFKKFTGVTAERYVAMTTGQIYI